MAIYANIAVILQVMRLADHALIARIRSMFTSQNIQGIMSVSTVVILQVMRLVDHAQKARLRNTSTFDTMNINEFVSDVGRLLDKAAVLSRSGGILYSASHTLTKGDLYILGLNPGGSEGPRISEDLVALPTKIDNSYLDESWRGYAPGEAPLQRRIKKLVESVGTELSNVCASNLIFMRSQDAKGIEYPNDADICWSVHKKVLDIVQPKLIIAFGNSSCSPYRYLFYKFNKDGREDTLDSGHGSWKCRGFEALIEGRNIYIAGFPHLSRYSPFDKDGYIKVHLATWLKEKL